MLRCRLTVLLSVLLLLAQLAVSVHAAEHLFHEDDESCAVFILAEHNASPDLDVSHQVIDRAASFINVRPASDVVASRPHHLFHARAPPPIRSYTS